ncbi:unnamed protein product [Lactuca saligna]|uniref:Uncharacterized protein n=1 Tax=Lactuca saligna TaxID=75948 RepID=A0AA35ZIW5_LACSI|nr:unnamed protein product [Lactuca saligna]
MAKRISKKKKKTKERQLVISTQSSEYEDVPETPVAIPIIEPSSPEKTVFILPKVSSAKSFFEEDIFNNKLTHLPKVLLLLFPVLLSLYLHTLYLPLLPLSQPPFENIINEPFTSIFSSQSTDPPKPMDECDNEEDGFGGTFKALAFDEEEEDFPNHILMSMKQFKILNKMLNSIIQSQANIGGGSSVSSFELDGMMKAFEARMVSKIPGMVKESESKILEKVDNDDHTTELWVRKYVNFKLQELCDDMIREFAIVHHDYATLHKKVDIICDSVT